MGEMVFLEYTVWSIVFHSIISIVFYSVALFFENSKCCVRGRADHSQPRHTLSVLFMVCGGEASDRNCILTLTFYFNSDFIHFVKYFGFIFRLQQIVSG